MTHILTAVFSPLNISLPTLKLLQIRSTKIAYQILRLNIENCLSLNQTFQSASQPKNLKQRKKGEKELFSEA
jgi:hypothetical protein